jgi:Holliday junction resolvase RusA-like endonuclease
MAEYSFTLPVPPSANRYWKIWNNRIVVTPEAKAYKQTIFYKLHDYEPLRGNVGVNYTVFRPAKRGDLDNYTKIMLSYRADDKNNPRVEFLVYEV